MKHGDFPVRYVKVYQRVWFCKISNQGIYQFRNELANISICKYVQLTNLKITGWWN